MTRLLRRVARALLGVERPPVYYLPWLVRPGIDCVLMLSNLEARFRSGHNAGPFAFRVTQYAADGRLLAEHHTCLKHSTDVAEVTLAASDTGWGFVTIGDDPVQPDRDVPLPE